MNDLLIETPKFVLLQQSERIGPALNALDTGKDCLAIYGFSEKKHFDTFTKNSDLSVTPYPLVIGYLQNRLDADEAAILMVALNATGPNDPVVNATSMQLVIEALKKKSPQVAVTHRLSKDESSSAYNVEDLGSVPVLRIHR